MYEPTCQRLMNRLATEHLATLFDLLQQARARAIDAKLEDRAEWFHTLAAMARVELESRQQELTYDQELKKANRVA